MKDNSNNYLWEANCQSTMGTDKEWLTISDLAQELDVSTRTIRYYEELGLIQPERTERGNRLYTRRDRARLRLILRGKRFGFSLEEIKEMIELFGEDRTGHKQLERTIQYGEQKLQEITERIVELTLLKEEIAAYKIMFEEKLREETGKTTEKTEETPKTID